MFQFKRQAESLPTAPPWTHNSEKGAGHPCLRKSLGMYAQKRLSDRQPSLICEQISRGKEKIHCSYSKNFSDQLDPLLSVLAVMVLLPACVPARPPWCVLYSLCRGNSRETTPNPDMARLQALSHCVFQNLSEANLSTI